MDHISPASDIATLVTAVDGLDFPTNAAFGNIRGSETYLSFANLAFLTFTVGGEARPGLMKIDVGVPGKPLSR